MSLPCQTMYALSRLLLFGVVCISGNQATENVVFPPDFVLGAGGASYQIEGAWNISDKGENVWDRFSHDNPHLVVNGDTGDVACDSYHKYKEDVALVKELGFDTYRFSLSWSRILPTGFADKVSQDGIKYYHNLIDELLANGIQPSVTLYHWDHPQSIEELGGWTNAEMVNWFGDYARVVFKEFGPKVKFFTTVNEPNAYCIQGYSTGVKAPGKKIHGIGEYLCGHNMLKANARAYHIYNDEFRSTQNGTIGIVFALKFFYPKNADDQQSAEIALQFHNGWLAHPIFSADGDYPAIMKQMVANASEAQGFPTSRLPEFTPEWIEYIKGSADYFGINHYTTNLVEPGIPPVDAPSIQSDQGLVNSGDPAWSKAASNWLYIVPSGFGDLLRKIKSEYNNPPIYVTENGMSDRDSIEDHHRISYYHDYLKEMLTALHRDNVNVKGYIVWALLDNYEWERGYSERFGIVHVDFEHPERTRTTKLSAHWWKAILKSRELQPIVAEKTES